jgi:hypothetical protein
MVAAEVAAVHSMARFVNWGWHLLALIAIFVLLGWWVRRDLAGARLPEIVVITVAVQLTGLLVFPLTSDDVYRYVPDGRVQLAGIDPYRFAPLVEAVRGLRNAALFPPGRPPLINRPTVPTIYPPGHRPGSPWWRPSCRPPSA